MRQLFLLFLFMTIPFHVDGKITPEITATIIQSLKEHFSVKRVFILIDYTQFNLHDEMFTIRVEKALAMMNTGVAVVQMSRHGEHNQPLYVMLSANNTSVKQFSRKRDARARWLQFLSDSDEVTEVFKDKYIPINCEFVVGQAQNEIINFKEVYRINSTLPLVVQDVGNWSQENGLLWTKNSIYKRRNNLHGMVFRTAVIGKEYITRIYKMESGRPIDVRGYFGNIWRALQHRMNFSTLYLKPLDGWGRKLPCGSWTGLLGVLIRREADVGLASLTITNERTKVVDFLFPLMDGTGDVMIREPTISEFYWSMFFTPFKLRLWIIILLVLCLVTLGLWIAGKLTHRINRTEINYYNLYNSLFTVFGIFCAQGQPVTPNTWSCRTVYLTGYMMGIIILAAYSAALTSSLTVHRVKLPFDSLQGLVRDGTYQFHVNPSSNFLEYFTNTNDEVLDEIYTSYLRPLGENMPDPEEGIQNVCKKDKYAYMLSSYLFMGIRNLHGVECNIVALPRASIKEFFSIALTKDNPYIDQFNYNLKIMKSSGLLQRLSNIYWHRESQEQKPPLIEVSFEEALPVLTILLSGCLVATVFLAIERGIRAITYRRNRRKFFANYRYYIGNPA